MSTSVTSFANPVAYLTKVTSYLEEKEAANQLLLGAALAHSASAAAPDFYAAAVGENDGWTGTAFLSGGRLFAYGQTATAMRALAADLAATSHRPRSVTAPGTAAQVLADAFATPTGQGYFAGLQQRCYQLTEAQGVVKPAGQLRAGREKELPLLADWLAAVQEEAFGRRVAEAQVLRAARQLLDAGALYVWEVDRPVAMLATGLPTRRGTPLAQLYTRPSLRNRGYATALVAGLSRLLLENGRAFTTALIDISAAVPTYVFLKAGFKSVTDLYTYHFAPVEAPAQSP